MSQIIKTENLTHIYGEGTPFKNVAIHDIDFSVEEGEFLAIIGHTGSGKSTFIQHLNGLIKPSSGKVYFGGRDIHESKEATRDIRFKVGLVFQYPEYQLFEETVYRDIAFGPKNMKLSEAEIHERVYEAAGFVGLTEEELSKSPFDLSGGQKRRAAIAGVIAMRPDVLILDEPTAGLDPRGSSEIMANINSFRESMGSTVIMVTHNMEEAARNASRIVVFSGGSIAMTGAPSVIFSETKVLSGMGLAAPQATQIASRLRELGVPLGNDLYTVAQLKEAICALKGGEVYV